MKCAKCGRTPEKGEKLVEKLWRGGPNGMRRYPVCAKCAAVIDATEKPITSSSGEKKAGE